jgi:hypothetical protein
MSYIRSGSNPEKLYIWGGLDTAEIAEGSKPTWGIPINIFDGLLKKYHRRFHEFPCQYKGAKVDEVWVDEDGNEGVSDAHLKPLQFKVKLSYEDHSVIMWLVTWEYIVNGEINKL